MLLLCSRDTFIPSQQRDAYIKRSYIMEQAYEVHNPSFNDMTLREQIEHGINDWAAEGKSGHLYFGRTKEEAEAIRAAFNHQ